MVSEPYERAGRVMSVFDEFEIFHPLLDRAFQSFDMLRAYKRSKPNSPQSCASIFAPSQAGKSKTIKLYIRAHVMGERGLVTPDSLNRCEKQKIVLHITLPQPATPKTLAIEILKKLGDPAPTRGNTVQLQHRADILMRESATELLFVDEVQHLTAAPGSKGDANGVSENLKLMLERGAVPIVLVGISEARHHLFNNTQLSSRCVDEIKYILNLDDTHDRDCFVRFCGILGLKLRDSGLFDEPSDFVSGLMPAALFEASGGLMGMTSNIVKQASIQAALENTSSVSIRHLAWAVDNWAIPRGICHRNPFKGMQ